MTDPATGDAASPPPNAGDDEEDFVNREIDRYLDLWKHTDERTLGSAPAVLGLSAALVPAAAVLLADTVQDTRRLYLASAPVLVLFAVLGMLTAFRIIQARCMIRAYELHTRRLRHYFVKRYPGVAPYVTGIRCARRDRRCP